MLCVRMCGSDNPMLFQGVIIYSFSFERRVMICYNDMFKHLKLSIRTANGDLDDERGRQREKERERYLLDFWSGCVRVEIGYMSVYMGRQLRRKDNPRSQIAPVSSTFFQFKVT